MMRNMRRFSTTVFILIIALIWVPAAFAHPLGNFTTNHYAGLHVKPDAITIDFVLDMAEIPAFQEIDLMDANRNGKADPEESAGYHPGQCEKISADLDLRIAGNRMPLRLISSTIEFPPGQGGLPTLRLNCFFEAFIPSNTGAMQVEYEDHSYPTRLGWREIVVTGEGVSLQGDFSTNSLSHKLSEYPQDLLTSPLNQRQVSFQVAPTPNAPQEKQAMNEPGSPPLKADKNDAFTRLILLENITLPVLLIALMVSFMWGAMHALTPGHGKTIVGAYLVGSRGTAKHAFYLGLVTTITHTTGVYVLGLVTLFAAQFILPEKLFPWLSFISGLLVVGIGANLFFSRMKATGILTKLGVVMNKATHDDHPHDHHHTHDHTHSREHPYPHHHDHHHGQGHDQDGDEVRAHKPHLPPGADGSPVTARSLLALGISGGLLPCPSALVVLLSAIALNRVGFGLVLVLAFSLGLAGVLTAVGLLFVYAGRFFNRIPVQGRILHLLPAVSALFITLAGFGITIRALVETGFINL